MGNKINEISFEEAVTFYCKDGELIWCHLSDSLEAPGIIDWGWKSVALAIIASYGLPMQVILMTYNGLYNFLICLKVNCNFIDFVVILSSFN